MVLHIDWSTLQTCDVCNETYVKVPTPKVNFEKFIENEPCSGCGHKSLEFE